MSQLKILDVGHCNYDGPRMKRLWQEKLHAHVDEADSTADALDRIAKTKYDLVLVNRIHAFTDESGLDTIKALLAADASTPAMLVSDKPDAQKQAEAIGARPGFGKAQLGDDALLDFLRKSAGAESA